MNHIIVSITLFKESENWKDRMAGWHTWKVVTRCPKNNSLVTEKVSGRRDEVSKLCINHPDCKCQEQK